MNGLLILDVFGSVIGIPTEESRLLEAELYTAEDLVITGEIPARAPRRTIDWSVNNLRFAQSLAGLGVVQAQPLIGVVGAFGIDLRVFCDGVADLGARHRDLDGRAGDDGVV